MRKRKSGSGNGGRGKRKWHSLVTVKRSDG
jgi:hypothetical protein